MISRKVILLSAFSLILAAPALADAPPTHNFAKKRAAANEAPSEVRSEPAVKESKVIIIRNGAPVRAMNDAPAAAPVVHGCDGGLADPASAPLPVFYTATQVTKTSDAAAMRLAGLNGKLSYNGQSYVLTGITLPKGPSRPFSGVEFPMAARFEHVSADNNRVIVTAPMRIGTPNLTLEKILLDTSETPIDLAQLLPANRAYAVTGECVAGGFKTVNFVMTTPVEVSVSQVERFSQSF